MHIIFYDIFVAFNDTNDVKIMIRILPEKNISCYFEELHN